MADGRKDIVVLGGGLAGLSAGMFTDAPVYEAASRIGGAASADTIGGFTFDRGIHVLQTNNQLVLDLLDELGVEFNFRDRSAHIYAFDRFTAYPFQINSTNLPIGRRLKCVWDFLNRARNPDPENYEEWIRRTIGNGFADTFLIPYSEKFWTVHPREMTSEWTGNRVPTANLWQVLRGALVSRNTRVGTNASFRYPAGPHGYHTVAGKIGDRISELYLDHRATHIDFANRRVVFNDEIEVSYEILVSTIPIPELISITNEVPDDVRAHTDRLRTNKILVVNLGIDRANITDKHWVHFPEKDFSFFRISFPHNFSAQLAPAGKSSVSAEVSYTGDAPPDQEEVTQRVIADLIRAGVLRQDDSVVAKGTYDIKYGYCIYDTHRQKTLPLYRDWLKTGNIVPGGRYGLWTYFWSDEAILSGRQSAMQAKKLLNTIKHSAGDNRP